MRALSLLCILALSAACGGDGSPDDPKRRAQLELLTGARAGVDVDWLVDFGSVTVGERRTRLLVLHNAGDAPAILEPMPLDPPFYSQLEEGAEIAAGETLEVDVGVMLEDTIPVERVTRLTWQEGSFDLRLRAGGASCAYDLSTEPLDFGGVEIGSVATLEVRIESIGLGACRIDGIEVEGPGFGAPDRAAALVRPGMDVVVAVTFSPEVEAPAEGALHLVVGGDAHTIPLAGQGRDRCVIADPPLLDFEEGASCQPRDRTIEIENRCTQPIVFEGATLVDGQVGFFVADRPPSQLDLATGERHPIVVTFTGPHQGSFEDTLEVEVGTGTLQIPLSASSTGETPPRVDSFDVPPDPAVDVLVVVDDTDRMAPFTDRLDGFAESLWLALDGRDFRLGVTTATMLTTPGCATAPRGRLLPLDGSDTPRILDPTTPDLVDLLADRLQPELCQDGTVAAAARSTLEATGRLAELADDPNTILPNDGNLGFLRPGTDLAVLYLLGGDDPGPTMTSSDLISHLIQVNPGSRSVVETWTPGHCGGGWATFFEEVARLLGMAHDLCVTPLDGPFLPGLPGVTRIYPVYGYPTDRNGDGRIKWEDGEFRVAVDGVEVPAIDPDTGERVWTYIDSTSVVRFEPGHLPPGGSHLTFTYSQPCGYELLDSSAARGDPRTGS